MPGTNDHHFAADHQYDNSSNEAASENSVDIAAPIVSALQAAPTKAQVHCWQNWLIKMWAVTENIDPA